MIGVIHKLLICGSNRLWTSFRKKSRPRPKPPWATITTCRSMSQRCYRIERNGRATRSTRHQCGRTTGNRLKRSTNSLFRRFATTTFFSSVSYWTRNPTQFRYKSTTNHNPTGPLFITHQCTHLRQSLPN